MIPKMKLFLALACGLVTALAIPLVPPGLPILLAAAVGAAWGWLRPAPPAAVKGSAS